MDFELDSLVDESLDGLIPSSLPERKEVPATPRKSPAGSPSAAPERKSILKDSTRPARNSGPSGRKPVPTPPQARPGVLIRLDPAIHRRLRIICSVTGVSMSRFISDCIAKELSSGESDYDALIRKFCGISD